MDMMTEKAGKENTRYLFDEKFSDGKIIVMPEKEKPQTDEIQKQLDKLADKRILVLVSDQRFDKEELLLRYQAVMTLKGDKRFIEENEVLLQELELCVEDIRFEINIYLEGLGITFITVGLMAMAFMCFSGLNI